MPSYMPAGNSSNTVFTTIPVGEDFYMVFPTERHLHNIAPSDITKLTFRLYDARIIGSVGNPEPSALIKSYNNLTYNVTTNPLGQPDSFTISPTTVGVLVTSANLDTYEVTKTAGVTTIFRGELYGYVDAIVTGEETKYAQMVAVTTGAKLTVTGNLFVPVIKLFQVEDLKQVKCKAAVPAATLLIFHP